MPLDIVRHSMSLRNLPVQDASHCATCSGVPCVTIVPPPSPPSAQIDDPVGGLDHVEIVLDDDHGIAFVYQSLQHEQQFAHVLEVQARGRFVEDIHCLAGGPALQLGGELDALRLSAGQRGRGLPEANIPQSDLHERVEVAGDRRVSLEERGGLLDRHIKHVGDGLAVVFDLQGFAVVPLAVAFLAFDVHVGQEVHLDLERAVAVARLAAPPLTLNENRPSL